MNLVLILKWRSIPTFSTQAILTFTFKWQLKWGTVLTRETQPHQSTSQCGWTYSPTIARTNLLVLTIAILHYTRLMALCPGLPRWAGTRKVKPIWILLKQQTVSSSGISWAICKSASRSRQITTPAPHHSVFKRPDALPASQPTASKHWRQYDHSQRIDKYLDSWRQITNAADCVAIDHFQKSQSQDGGLPKLLLAYSCLTNYGEAASPWLVTPKQDIGDHQWPVICCNAEYLNFRMQNAPVNAPLNIAMRSGEP